MPRAKKPGNRTHFADIIFLDLFGGPIDPWHGQPGRPRHIPTAATRARVLELRTEGLNLVQIATAIGITQPTLQLAYVEQLGPTRSQTARRRAERDQQEQVWWQGQSHPHGWRKPTN